MLKFRNRQEFIDEWEKVPNGLYIKLEFHDGHIELWNGKAVRCSENKLEIKVTDTIIIYWKKPYFYKIAYVNVIRR